MIVACLYHFLSYSQTKIYVLINVVLAIGHEPMLEVFGVYLITKLLSIYSFRANVKNFFHLQNDSFGPVFHWI